MSNRPNILFLFPDQWRADCLGWWKHPVVKTPFLDELAEQSVQFTAAYSPSPTCIPARACLATGLRPASTGRVGYRDGVPWEYPNTFMRLLRDGGYQTLCAGKTHFHPARARLGFEELSLYEVPCMGDEPSDYHRWLREQTGGNVRDTAEEMWSNSALPLPWEHPEYLHPTAWTVTAAIEQLERREPTRPFLQHIGYHRPHPPFDPPLRFWESFRGIEMPAPVVGDWVDEVPDSRSTGPFRRKMPAAELAETRRAYFASLAHVDYQIGRMIEYLRGKKLLENTWILFASDHGEMLGDHHYFRKTTPLEASARIPLLIRPPVGLKEAISPRESPVPVSLEDLSATFLQMGEIEVPTSYEGHGLLEHLRGAEFPRSWVHIQHNDRWQGITDGQEKFIWNTVEDHRFFFDLRKDPQECHNLAKSPEYAERLRIWEQRLIASLKDGDQELSDGKQLLPRSFGALTGELKKQLLGKARK